jgi:hypothetical protein
MPEAGLHPLPDSDYQIMGCTEEQFEERVYALPEDQRRFVLNANHRLATVYWLTSRLDQEVRTAVHAGPTESLLSLQVYLLLTCADTLGHIGAPGAGPGARFRGFFDELPERAKQRLTAAFAVWRTDYAEMQQVGLASGSEWNTPSAQQVIQRYELLSADARLRTVVSLLYARRNWFTHEAEYPQWGYLPGLAVLQMQRLGRPDAGHMWGLERLQLVLDVDRSRHEWWHFIYYRSVDPVADLRTVIVLGLGKILGFSH